MPPVRNIQSGVYPGTPCGCTHPNLTALQLAVAASNPTYAICGTKNFLTGGVDPVIVGSPPTNAAKCYANECDGVELNTAPATGQYISLGQNGVPSVGAPLSVEIWLKTGAAPSGLSPIIGSIGNNAHVPWSVVTDGNIVLGTSGTLNSITWSSTWLPGQCTQLAFSVPNDGVTNSLIWRDGALDKSVAPGGGVLSHYATMQDVYAGYAKYLYTVSKHYLNMTVYLIAVYDSVLTTADILAHWNARS